MSTRRRSQLPSREEREPFGPEVANYALLNEAHRAKQDRASAPKRAKSPQAPDKSHSDESDKRLPQA